VLLAPRFTGRVGVSMRVQSIALSCFIAILVLTTSSLSNAKSPKGDGYRKGAIADARFGTGDRETLLKKSYQLSSDLNAMVFGQEAATAALQSKMVQYLEGYPHRTGEPVMMNMIGLPGIGKSAIIEYLKANGYPVVEFDAQAYSGSGVGTSLESALNSAINDHKSDHPDRPLIVVVEELDKLIEKSASGVETTSSAIGTMNMISSEGKIHGYNGKAVPVSNVMFITTMNLSPVEIESFSMEVLKVQKSYYDFTIEDFEKFDIWIRSQPSARYKVLARMFRSNTVGRFGANTTIMQPLGSDTYKRIIELQVQRAIRQNAQDKNGAKRVTVEVHPSMMDFLLREAVYAPSGARETVSLSNSLIEQLITYGTKAVGPGVESSERPRHIEIRYQEQQDRVFVRVTEKVLKPHSATELREGNAIAFQVRYDAGSRLFMPPAGISSVKPAPLKSATAAFETVKPVTKKETFDNRFPKSQERTKGMREKIASQLFGQTDAISTITTDFENYFGRQGPAKKEPSSRALAGFPGIGKSELFLRAADATELPVARINMQTYATDSVEAVGQFTRDLSRAIEVALEGNKSGQYLLLIEELDKVFEIDQLGKFVNRPIMAKIKDLLNDGKFEVSGDYRTSTVDARAAFIGITMNFAVDRFGFEADPRMTSIEDVINAWKKLKATPAAIKNILGSMFLPDTVSRLMTQLSIMKPLDRPAYQKVIVGQTLKVRGARLLDHDGRNVGQIELAMTTAYRRYLFSESVIPSEGARNTSKSANTMISTDLEYALARLPRSSKYAREPLTITLDYSEAKQRVRYRIQLTNQPDETPLKLNDRDIALRFPPTKIIGRVSEERMHTSAHEFGHAFTAAQMGVRFEYVVVVESAGAAGYVKPNGKGSSAADHLGRIRMILGSRVFERVFMSPNPMMSESVLSITSGPSRDIQMATLSLYEMLYLLGMNPNGGTLDRNFNMGGGKYATIADMPSELAYSLGQILRDMEDSILRETLEEHSREWYIEKITKLSRAGSMDEKEFYNLIERKLPAADRRSVGTINEYFRSLFKNGILKPTSIERKAANNRTGNTRMTPAERTQRAMESFTSILSKRLAPSPELATALPVVRSCRALFTAN
jgi:hypothetical protein